MKAATSTFSQPRLQCGYHAGFDAREALDPTLQAHLFALDPIRMASRTAGTGRRYIVRRSTIHGRGVFALANIPKGTRLMEYIGERISHREADRPDAYGAMCALLLGLQALGKKVAAFNQDGALEQLLFLPGVAQVQKSFLSQRTHLLQYFFVYFH